MAILLTAFAKDLLNKHRGAIKYSVIVKDSGGELSNGLVSFYLGYHEARLTKRAVNFCIKVIEFAAFSSSDSEGSWD